jgi:peptide subunit release factor 1 (eRF1)
VPAPLAGKSPGTFVSRARPDSPAEEVLRVGTVERIERFHGGDLSVLSLYLCIPAGWDSQSGARTKADSLLHEVRRLTEDHSRSHDSRRSLREDIEWVEEVVAEVAIRPGALAMFACSGAGLREIVPFPRPVRDRIVVDETPWTRPMTAVLDEYERCCVAVIDKGNAQAWELHLDSMRQLGRLGETRWREQAHETNAHRAGAKAEELEKRHFRAVAEQLDELQRRNGFDVLVLGGHEDELGRFEGFLSKTLRQRLGGSFRLDDDRLQPAAVRERTHAILEDRLLARQRQAVADAFERAASGGLAAVGLRSCLWAGSAAAIDTLIVQEGATAPGVVCDESRWLALSGDSCPICGRPTRQTEDVIDELVEAVTSEGGSFRPVWAETELERTTAAAALRFPLPPEP